MALAFVKEVATADETNSNATTVLTVPAGGVAAGNLLVLGSYRGGAVTISSVSDSGSNTWTVPAALVGRNDHTTHAAYCLVSSALSSGNAITITWSAAGFGDRLAKCAEFSGVASTDFLAGSSTGQAVNFGSQTATTDSGDVVTSDADVVLVGINAPLDGTATVTAPSTSFTRIGTDVDAASCDVEMEYRIVSATGTYTTNATLSASSYWNSYLFAFKADGGGGGDPEPSPRLLGTLGVGT